jgi:hypothetical protein
MEPRDDEGRLLGVRWDEDEPVPPSQDTVASLARRLPDQVSRLVRAEAELARLELSERAKVVAVGAGAFGAGAVLLFVAFCAVAVAAGLGLANVMQGWLAALVVAGACVLLAGLIVLPGWRGIRDRRAPEPLDSFESLKADLHAVLDGAHR